MAFTATRLRAVLTCVFLMLSSGSWAQGSRLEPITPQSLAPGGKMEEATARSEVARQFGSAFLNEQFQRMEQLYRQALSQDERLPSGMAKLDWWVLSLYMSLPLPPAAYDPDPQKAAAAKDAHWRAMDAKAVKWQTQIPDSTAAVVFRSAILLKHGFAHRGGGYASTVTPEGMRTFGDFVEQAYRVLVACTPCAKKDPMWHAQMIEVAKLQGWRPAERHDKVIHNAVMAFPYFYGIYFGAADALLPKWGGNVDDLEKFARAAVDLTREKEGKALYARIYWSAAFSLNGNPFKFGRADWPTMKQGFEDMVRRYPGSWNMSAYAYFACAAEDLATFKEVVARVGDQLDTSGWIDPRLTQRCLPGPGQGRS